MTKNTLLAVIFCFSGIAHTTPQLFNDPWKFLDDQFIEKIDHKMNRWDQVIRRAVITGGINSAILFGANSYKTAPYRTSTVAAITAATSIPTYCVLFALEKQRLEVANVQEFLANLDQYKTLLPRELVSAFESMKSNPRPDYEEFSRVIKQAIYSHFVDKYKNVGNGFFDTRLFTSHAHFELGSILNGAANLLRAFNERITALSQSQAAARI